VSPLHPPTRLAGVEHWQNKHVHVFEQLTVRALAEDVQIAPGVGVGTDPQHHRVVVANRRVVTRIRVWRQSDGKVIADHDFPSAVTYDEAYLMLESLYPSPEGINYVVVSVAPVVAR
jgi:hypothetical protein